jgi:hypothetical protein
VGTQGHKLISQYDANPGNPALCLSLSQPSEVAPNTPTCGPYGEQTTYTRANGQQVFGTRTALGPAFGADNSFTANIANSNYASFQTSLERKAGDATYLVAYTYAKAIDNSSGFNDWVNYTNYRLSRSLSAYDVRSNFVASYSYALPFNRMFKSAPRRLTQGWQLSGITRLSTGFPVGISQGAGDNSLTGSPNTDTPDLIGPVVTQNPHNPGPYGPNTFFLPGAFASEPLGSFGTASRRFFSGPGIANWDVSLQKTTKIRESMAFELRGEFFNVFNHTQFGGPNGNYSSGIFGVVTTARDPRIGQMSFKFVF